LKDDFVMMAQWQRLYRSLGRFLYGGTTILLVVWLALFAPATCVYHGFLLTNHPVHAAGLEDPPSARPEAALAHDAHAHHRAHRQAHPAEHQTGPNRCNIPPGGAQVQHRPLTNDTSMMSLLAMAVPKLTTFNPPELTSFQYLVPLIAWQLFLPPPDQPPRLA
jgi:hypothetical protein